MDSISRLRLSDDILLLFLDELSQKPADLVNFALTNRHVHALAHAHLAEHQSLVKEFTIVCLNYHCTHKPSCAFVCRDPADLVELCKPGLKVFEYIKCINLSHGRRGFTDPSTTENWKVDTIAKIRKKEYLNSIYEAMLDGSLLQTETRFMHPATIEHLFLWQLSQPTVIRIPTAERLFHYLSIAASTATECKLQSPASSGHHWKHLVISMGERQLGSGYLNHIADNTMHLVVLNDVVQNLLTKARFWYVLRNMCQVECCSFEKIVLDLGHLPADPVSHNLSGPVYWHRRINNYGDTDTQLRRLFDDKDSRVQEVRISGVLETTLIEPQFPDSERLNDPQCKGNSHLFLEVSKTKRDDYFQLIVTEEKSTYGATNEIV